MERSETMPAVDAIADARTLVVNSKPRYGDDLWAVLDLGSRAVVACLDGNESLARSCAAEAAHAAFRLVPGLR